MLNFLLLATNNPQPKTPSAPLTPDILSNDNTICKIHNFIHEYLQIPMLGGIITFIYYNEFKSLPIELMKFGFISLFYTNLNENRDLLRIDILHILPNFMGVIAGLLSIYNFSDNNGKNPLDTLLNSLMSDNILLKSTLQPYIANPNNIEIKGSLSNSAARTSIANMGEIKNAYNNLSGAAIKAEDSMDKIISSNFASFNLSQQSLLVNLRLSNKSIFNLWIFTTLISKIKLKKLHSPALIIGSKAFIDKGIYMLHQLMNNKSVSLNLIKNEDKINQYIEKVFALSNSEMISEFISPLLAQFIQYRHQLSEMFKYFINEASFTKGTVSILQTTSGFRIREFSKQEALSLHLETSKLLELLRNIKSSDITIFTLNSKSIDLSSIDPSILSRLSAQIIETSHTYQEILNGIKGIFFSQLFEFVDQEYINNINITELLKLLFDSLASYFNFETIEDKIDNIIAYIIENKGIIDFDDIKILCM